VKPQPGTFLVLQREWKSGDRVTLEMPMGWRLVKGRQRQAGRVAIMRGPLIFSLNPASYPEVAKQDAADLGAFLLDPSTWLTDSDTRRLLAIETLDDTVLELATLGRRTPCPWRPIKMPDAFVRKSIQAFKASSPVKAPVPDPNMSIWRPSRWSIEVKRLQSRSFLAASNPT